MPDRALKNLHVFLQAYCTWYFRFRNSLQFLVPEKRAVMHCIEQASVPAGFLHTFLQSTIISAVFNVQIVCRIARWKTCTCSCRLTAHDTTDSATPYSFWCPKKVQQCITFNVLRFLQIFYILSCNRRSFLQYLTYKSYAGSRAEKSA